MGNSIIRINADLLSSLVKPSTAAASAGKPHRKCLFASAWIIDLKPRVVVILASINDIAQKYRLMTFEETFGNDTVACSRARKANKMSQVSSGIAGTACVDFPWRPGMQPAEK